MLLSSLGSIDPVTRAAVPAPGTDRMPAAGSIGITVDGSGTDVIRLTGDLSIVRHPPDPGLPETVPIEIVGLNLAGFSPVLGQVTVQPHLTLPIAGATQRIMGVESPSDSFFDVHLVIGVPNRGLTLRSGAPFRVQAGTTAVPFLDVFTEVVSQSVSLIDEATGFAAGSLTHVALDPNPRVDILLTEARLDWTIGTSVDTVDLTGQSIVVASDSWQDPGPTTTPEFNTEIIAMDLTGVSPAWGGTLFVEQVMLHSPGRVQALDPGTAQFPADSFFDVFFDIHASGFDVYCAGALTGRATVETWPALGLPYGSTGPCNLIDSTSGLPAGTLDGFSWTWTEAGGTCVDADGDGVQAAPCGTDCDDNDPDNYPGNLESCSDSRDNNCNQAIDCQDALCSNSPCDDGDACTQTDTCQSGACVGSNPVICTPLDQCHDPGVCDPATGVCSNPAKPDGTTCDDGDACTQTDTCQTGACVGSNPVICTALDQCHDPGVCDPATGVCSNPAKPDGATCDDGDACTQSDTCQSGACVGINPVVCTALDQCHDPGVCDPATGVCSNPAKPDGTTCDDSDGCTQTDTCQTGACVGSNPLICDDGLLCTIDHCDRPTGQCVYAPVQCSNGLFCDGLETCDPANGACQPGMPPDCSDGDACTRDACSDTAGACVHVRTKTLVGTDGSGGNLYRIDPATGSADFIGSLGFAAPSLAVDPTTGILYAGEGAGVPTLHIVNPDTGAALPVGDTGFGGAALAGLAFDATGRLFASVNLIDDGGTGADTLAIIDTDTGAGTAIGAFGGGIGGSDGPGGIEGIAFDALGRLYGTSARQTGSDPAAVPTLYTIDVATGVATAIGPLLDVSGGPPPGGVVGLDFDTDGTLYGGTGQGTGYLVRIDPATAQFTLIGPSVSRSLATVAFLRCGCTSDAACNDGSACTTDACNVATGVCEYTPLACDDGDACTADACDPAAGCIHPPVQMDEPQPLMFDSQTTMSWPATPDATHWNAYRGTIPEAMLGSRPPGLEYDHACHESADALGDGPTASSDASDPPAGTAYYYLDTGEGTCGESDVGRASSGAVIPNPQACPTPP